MDTVTSGDGTTIAYAVLGNGPPLVMVHGSTGAHDLWGDDIVSELGRHFTVFVMDRRGRGASADGKNYALELEFQDVAAVVRAAGRDVRVLGHSFGALCALEAALLSDEVARIVLYEPPFSIDGRPLYSPGLRRGLEARLNAGDREEALKAFYVQAAGMTKGEVEAVQADPSWAMRVASVHTAIRELTIEEYRFDVGKFRSVYIPTLLLVGEQSPAMLTAPSRALSTVLPNSRLLPLEGQGHVAMATAPDMFLRAVIDFMSD